MYNKRLIIALDFPAAEQAISFVNKLSPGDCRLKVGFELYVAEGPRFVEQLVDMGFDVFLDLKFHDIPNTVHAACKAASRLGVWMLNVHALGGGNMLVSAVDAVHSVEKPPLLIAVTILTSMDELQLKGIGLNLSAQAQVRKLAELAKKSGLDGIVCSAKEVALLKQQLGDKFQFVTPGIRPENFERGDQSRVMTPGEAIHSGASYLVVGRPITQSTEPLQVISAINDEIMHASKR